MAMLAIGLAIVSMSGDQECLGRERCRPENVTYTAHKQSCQSCREKPGMHDTEIQHSAQVIPAAAHWPAFAQDRAMRGSLDSVRVLCAISIQRCLEQMARRLQHLVER